MEKREYGKTGIKLSIIGFGGIIVSGQTQEEANDFTAEAIDRGINYFDVAPTYGNAEERLGPALAGKRQGVFLACKTEDRTKAGAERMLHNSLRNLKTDYFDLYQFHAVATKEDVETVFGPNGAMEAFLKAKQEGLIKHIGFSAHSEDAAIALMEQFDFDSVLFPYNWVNIFNSRFGKRILEKAIEKKVTRMALKAMAKTVWEEGEEHTFDKCWYKPVDDRETAELALRFTLSQPITAAIPPGDIRLFRWAMDSAENFKPITSDEEDQLKIKSRNLKPIFG